MSGVLSVRPRPGATVERKLLRRFRSVRSKLSVYSSLSVRVGSSWNRAVVGPRSTGVGSTRCGTEGTVGLGMSWLSGMTGTGCASDGVGVGVTVGGALGSPGPVVGGPGVVGDSVVGGWPGMAG